MSRETIQWLNTMTLIGNTDQRGNAWHYRASDQGGESNHYPGFIPVGDVVRRLFDWEAVSRRVAVEVPADIETMTHMSNEGYPMRWIVQEDRQAIASSDDHTVMGLFKDGYQLHQYRQWLLTNVESILGEGLGVSSAGLLRGRANAWVEVSVPDTITTPEGVAFRPNLLACTSFDGSLASTYKMTSQLTVCDNTRDVALASSGARLKVKHSRNSMGRVPEVREALALVHTVADAFAAEVKAECETAVSNIQFREVLAAVFPIDDPTAKRAVTIAQDKRGEISRLYNYDPRVAPWKGTAFGVVQAFNTWSHHEQGGLPQGSKSSQLAARADRNSRRAITGETGKADTKILDALRLVLA